MSTENSIGPVADIVLDLPWHLSYYLEVVQFGLKIKLD